MFSINNFIYRIEVMVGIVVKAASFFAPIPFSAKSLPII